MAGEQSREQEQQEPQQKPPEQLETQDEQAEQAERAQQRAAIVRQEHQQRVLFAIFNTILFGALLFLCIIGSQMVADDARRIDAGHVDEYEVGVPKEIIVDRIEIDARNTSGPGQSEDIIFVVKRADGFVSAFLARDTSSQCFIHWNDEQSYFYLSRTPNCPRAHYTIDGTLIQSSVEVRENIAPVPMTALRVEVEDGQITVLDQRARNK